MQPIIYDVAVSADGFIAGASGDVSQFPHTGPVVDDYATRLQTYAAVLMGRATYQFGYAFGLKPGENPYPWAMSLVISPSIVLPDNPEVEVEVEVVRTDPAARIDRLRHMALGPIYLCGGGHLAGWLLREGLITHLRLKRAPVILGQGVPLFAGTGPVRPMTLTDSRIYKDGVIYQEYRL